MSLQKKDVPLARRVFEFIRNHADVDDQKIKPAVLTEFESNPIAGEIAEYYLTMRKGARFVEKLRADPAIQSACWDTAQAVRQHRSNRARTRGTREKGPTKMLVSAPAQAPAQKKWKQLLKLAASEPENKWAELNVQRTAVQDLQNALYRTQGGSSRERWFREQFASDPTLRARVNDMIETLREKRAMILAHRRGEYNRSATISRPKGETSPVTWQRGRFLRPWAPAEIKGTDPSALIHGPHWEKLVPVHLRKKKKKKTRKRRRRNTPRSPSKTISHAAKTIIHARRKKKRKKDRYH